MDAGSVDGRAVAVGWVWLENKSHEGSRWRGRYSGRGPIGRGRSARRMPFLRSIAHASSVRMKYRPVRDSAAKWCWPGRSGDKGNVMTGKLDENRMPPDDKISGDEIDAEYSDQSVRKRIDFAVQAKAIRQLPSRYFYEIIEEIVDDFLVEETIGPEKTQRSDEIQTAYNDLMPAYRVLREHVKDDRALDGAIRDVMWSSFLIGLACDWENNDPCEALNEYKSSVAQKARIAKKEKNDRWNNAIYRVVCRVIPDLMLTGVNMNNATKTYDYAKALESVVKKKISRMKLGEDLKHRKLTVYAIKMAVCRYIDEKKVRRLHKRKKPRTALKESS